MLLGIFVALFVLNYIFVSRHNKEAAKHVDLPASFPSDASGPWQSYIWQGKLFGYPNSWTLEENRATSDTKSQVVSFTLSPKEKKNQDDFIVVGGGEPCSNIRASLCIGQEPVYTNSKDSDVLIIYNTIIRHISEVKSAK
jgi:hypothetical protein